MGSLGLIFMRKAEPRGVQSHGAGARQGGWAPAGAASIPHGSSEARHFLTVAPPPLQRTGSLGQVQGQRLTKPQGLGMNETQVSAAET